MEESAHDQLPSIVAQAGPISQKIRAIAGGLRPVTFSHVSEPAQALLVAALAREISKTIWILCPNIRSQELLYESLLNWQPNALFLPEAEIAAVENILPDPEIAAERLALLNRVQREKGTHLIVATRAALEQTAPDPASLNAAVLLLRRGKQNPLERIITALTAAGYERVAQVTTRGQFAVRGGILDIFSWQASRPIRIEYFGDDVESLREFDVDTQTSLRNLQSVEILLEAAETQNAFVRDYVGADHLRLAIEPGEDETDAEILVAEAWLGGNEPEDFHGAFDDCDIGDFAVGDFMLVEAKRSQFAARLRDWSTGEFQVVIYFQTEGEIERFREIMGDAIAGIELREGTLPRGFVFPDGKLVVLSGAELFGRYTTHGRRRLQRAEQLSRNRAQIDFSELNEGDLVVHLEHGVGRFLQLTRVPSPAGEMQEALALEFANDARLYVPLEQAYLVSRYVGVGKKSPALSSLADAKWARAKKNAAASIFDYAGKMLAVQAERETQIGHAFGADTKWQREFEHSFPFRETPDQLTAIAATKNDMERARSMDRLICGDVGFGKTEVAIRAAFKAVMEGKQVAVLAPTTVLAQQHFETFRQRMLDYPVRIEMLSRFRSHGEQRKVLGLLREGGVDIVIGTHRLISGDVVFKDLGLVVIDEEQRFGVLHKEKFKELFKLVDVLTLSATPIPRTLYLSLVGVKDMSTIETPPLNRLPVETVVCGYDERIIRDAINRELDRQGQVYFLHNRVQSIEKMREKIADLCPRARVEFGHGQMDADELESVMGRFVSGKIDVLVCT
ncbi:MAG: DEAD/DEAH box helicase, partial [Chthoniobacterales bacterium]